MYACRLCVYAFVSVSVPVFVCVYLRLSVCVHTEARLHLQEARRGGEEEEGRRGRRCAPFSFSFGSPRSSTVFRYHCDCDCTCKCALVSKYK